MPIQLAAAGGVNLGAAGGAIVAADGSPCCCGGCPGDPAKFARTYQVSGAMYFYEGEPPFAPVGYGVNLLAYRAALNYAPDGYRVEWSGGTGAIEPPFIDVAIFAGQPTRNAWGHCFIVQVFIAPPNSQGGGQFSQTWGKDGNDPAGTYRTLSNPNGLGGDTITVS